MISYISNHNYQCSTAIGPNIIHGRGIIVSQDVSDVGSLLWTEDPFIHILFSIPVNEITPFITLNPSTKCTPQIQQEYEKFIEENELKSHCYIFYFKNHFQITNLIVEVKLQQLKAKKEKYAFYYWVEGLCPFQPPELLSTGLIGTTVPTLSAGLQGTAVPATFPSLPPNNWQLVYQFYNNKLSLNQLDLHYMIETIHNLKFTDVEKKRMDECVVVLQKTFPNDGGKNKVYNVIKRLNALQTTIIDPITNDTVGYGLYRMGCFLNHSCNPNACVTFDIYGKMNVYSIRPIMKDEEITISYYPGIYYDCYEIRQQVLKFELQGQSCICHVCKLEQQLKEQEIAENKLQDAVSLEQQTVEWIELRSGKSSSILEAIDDIQSKKKQQLKPIQEAYLKAKKNKAKLLQQFSIMFPYMTNWQIWNNKEEREREICNQLQIPPSCSEYYRITDMASKGKEGRGFAPFNPSLRRYLY